MIILNITKFEKNENFEEEMEQYKQGFWYSRNRDIPERQKEVNTLLVKITEEQFEAIRKAVLEVF